MRRSLFLSLSLAVALPVTGCQLLPAVPEAPKDTGPAPARTVAELRAHGTEEGEIELYELAAAHGLTVKIDLVAGRRLLTNPTNEVVVEPGSRSVAINKVAYPLTGPIKWRNGKLCLPGDARVVFGEHLRRLEIPEVKDYAYLDGIPEGREREPGPAPLTASTPPRVHFDPSVPPLPASWNMKANRTWSYVVIHHSATHDGGARSFDRAHSKKWTYGLGYHFVIGNGSETKDGEVEVGPRWLEQNQGIHGAHAGVDKFNQHGIGICLVGNFDRERPTPKQLSALTTLVQKLMTRYGIKKENIMGHSRVKSGHTDCPGKHFSVESFIRGL